MKHKSAIISTIVCLLPIALSAVLYGRLPERIPVHFDSSGAADNYYPKAVAAFGLPVFLAAVNLYIHFRVNSDPKKENASALLQSFSRWLIPLLSVIFVPISLFMAMGADIPIMLIAQSIIGAVVVVCGNYLPKCRKNYTIGIKLPWTLDNEDNWKKTHRFSGFVWVVGGMVILLTSFLSISCYVVIGIGVLLVTLPFMYSYLLYQSQLKGVE